MTALLAEPQTATHAGTPGDIHLVCEQHDPDRLLCGLDLADAPWNKSADLTDCVVCADLAEAPCGFTCAGGVT